MIETTICGYLLTKSAITALIGTRIRPIALQQGEALPAIAYSLVGESIDYRHSGKNYTESRMQFDVVATSYLAAKTIAEALDATLSGLSGTVGSIVVDGIFKNLEIDEYEDETKTYRVILDYSINYV